MEREGGWEDVEKGQLNASHSLLSLSLTHILSFPPSANYSVDGSKWSLAKQRKDQTQEAILEIKLKGAKEKWK